MKSKNLIRNVLVMLSIVLMSTVLCGAGCSNAADSSSGGGGTTAGGGSTGKEQKSVPQVGSIIMKDGSLKTDRDITPRDISDAIAVVYKVENGKAWAVGKVHEKKE